MLIFLYSALIVIFDQLFKHWIILTHSVGQETVLIPGFFSLFRLHNTGAAFGFMAGLPWWVLAAIQLIAVVILIMIILRYTEGFWGSLGLASVLGGAVGNLVDRVLHQYVVDMFRFTFVDFAIFNLADVFITLGFLIFLVHYIAQTFRPNKDKSAFEDDDYYADEEYDYSDASAEAVVDGVPMAVPVTAAPAAVPVDFETLAQVEPTVYGSPVAELSADGQTAISPLAQPMPQMVSPVPQAVQPVPQAVQPVPQAVQPMPQAVQPMPQAIQPMPQAVQPVPQAVQPMPQAIGQVAPAPQGDLTQPVDPASVFGASSNAEAINPLLDPTSQTGPLPTVEIAPLLDHVYGGQYLQKQEAAVQAAAAPPAAAPVAPPVAAPVAPPVAAPPPIPATPPAPPVAQPIPAAPPAPATPPAPAASPITVVPRPSSVAPAAPAATAPVAPAVSPTPVVAPTPAADIPIANDNPEKMLDALAALESELLGENALDDYNADKLLGEYGFESETKED